MFRTIKQRLYFPVAVYFRFFAQIQLHLWKPKIIVITGSNGKTTLLHLLEAQIGDRARYSHHANSTFGISFDILGFKRKNLLPQEWISLFCTAPFRAFKRPSNKKIYIVEADCDRPGEGKFLAALLTPAVTIWINTSRTHSMNFDKLIAEKTFRRVEEAIAYEFGYFLEYTTNLVIINGDEELMTQQLKRTNAPTNPVTKNQLQDYRIQTHSTAFKIDNHVYMLPGLLPKDAFYAIAMTNKLLDYLHIASTEPLTDFRLPPGRGSVLQGIKETTIIDSSYNASYASMQAICEMFSLYPAEKKWVVIGDMLEQGNEEAEEHEKLADSIIATNASTIILMGPRVTKYTYPKLKKLISSKTVLVTFTTPKQALEYLLQNLQGKETILFKGARFLEGVIEHLLAEKTDSKKLCRREKIWQMRRKKWDL